jgi:hypothetical protein
MRRLYQFILKFYPAEYRAAFAAEVLATFDQAIADSRQRGRVLRFATWELLGLLTGLLTEWAAKRARGPRYLAAPDSPLPEEIIDIHEHIQELIRNMEFAIAHHDFPNARRYSDEERIARARLNELIRERWGSGRAAGLV